MTVKVEISKIKESLEVRHDRKIVTLSKLDPNLVFENTFILFRNFLFINTLKVATVLQKRLSKTLKMVVEYRVAFITFPQITTTSNIFQE